MFLSYYGSSIVGSSGINADVYYVSDDKKVFLLADGASGAGEYGKVLMGKTCLDIVSKFDYAVSGLTPKEYITSLFNMINQRLIELSQEFKMRVFGTIIIAVVEGDSLTVTTLGDSPAYLYKKDCIIRVAKNKRRYESLVEKGVVTREQYEGYIEKMHYSMKACFDFFIPEILPNNIIEKYTISSEDIFFMCSDGLSDWISPKEIFGILQENVLSYGVDALLKQAKDKAFKQSKAFDDITAIAIQWKT